MGNIDAICALSFGLMNLKVGKWRIMMGEGRKDDTGKLRMDLVPVPAIRAMARGFGYGADKYTSRDRYTLIEIREEITKRCSCEKTINQLSATQRNATQPKDCASPVIGDSIQRQKEQAAIQTESDSLRQLESAVPVMIGILKNALQNTPHDKKPVPNSGTRTTDIELGHMRPITENLRELNPATRQEIERELLQALVSLGRMNDALLNSKTAHARYAEQNRSADSILITATKQEGLGAFSVGPATKDLDYSEILRNLLNEHSTTCVVRKLNIQSIETGFEIVTTGAWNWTKGLSTGRLYGALLRHLTAWWEGEETDPESGLSHLDHVLCCAAMLQGTVERKLAQDDRPHTHPRFSKEQIN